LIRDLGIACQLEEERDVSGENLLREWRQENLCVTPTRSSRRGCSGPPAGGDPASVCGDRSGAGV